MQGVFIIAVLQGTHSHHGNWCDPVKRVAVTMIGKKMCFCFLQLPPVASDFFHLFLGGVWGRKQQPRAGCYINTWSLSLLNQTAAEIKAHFLFNGCHRLFWEITFMRFYLKVICVLQKIILKGKTNFSFCGNIFNPWKPEPWTNSPQIIYICFVKKVKVFIEPFDKYFTSYNEHLWVLNIFRDAFLPISGNYAHTSRSR